MMISSAVFLAVLAGRSWGAVVQAALNDCSMPKLYLAGDSTMAPGGGGPYTDGWGQWLKYSLSIPVINDAIAGRSARSYTIEDRFDHIAAAVLPGDFVLIEFGHNDGGSPLPTDNGRSDCPGAGSETCVTSAGLVVQTFPTYMTNATNLMLSKGARVILSSPTPDNTWETHKFVYSSPRFTIYDIAVFTSLGNPNVVFVDHGQYLANRYLALGDAVVNSYYPHDHTHTSPEGADTVEKSFMKGLMCGRSALAYYSKNTTSSIAGSCI